jgi:integrase/recombinase XerD
MASVDFDPAVTQFLEALAVKNFSPHTLHRLNKSLGYFIRWADERGITQPADVTRPLLLRYQRGLYHQRKANGQPLAWRTQHAHLYAVRAFFRWLSRENYLLSNPASELELPRLEFRLPRTVLTPTEAAAVLNQPNIQDALGLRDRAMLETLYSTGMRRSELVALTLYDVDMDRGIVSIRQGKGRKDRTVPIGEQALAWIVKYRDDVRPTLVVEPDPRILFLAQTGHAIDAEHLTRLVRTYVARARIGKHGACHLFRHTCATLMLENGADIRVIQELLGHAQLASTQVYTQVSITHLKAIHTATHPSAKLGRPTRDGEDDPS